MLLAFLDAGGKTFYINPARVAFITAAHDNPSTTIVHFSGNDDDWVRIGSPLDAVASRFFG